MFRVKLIWAMLILFSIALPSSIWAAGEPGTAGTATGASWTSASNATGVKDANCASYNSTGQATLILTNYDFTTLVATDLVDSFVIQIWGTANNLAIAQREIEIQLTKDGTNGVGTLYENLALANVLGCNSTSSITIRNGLYGTTWTPAEVESSNFGIIIKDDDATASPIYINAINNMTVYFTSLTSSLSNLDTSMFSFKVLNDWSGTGSQDPDSVKWWMGHTATFADAWPTQTKANAAVTGGDTLSIYNLNPVDTFWVWSRIYTDGALKDSDSIQVNTAYNSYQPRDLNKWSYVDGDSIRFFQHLGTDLRYNRDSSGTWSEIDPEWTQDGSMARYHNHTGYYTAHADSLLRANIRLDTDTTDYVIHTTFPSIKWFNKNSSTIDSTCFPTAATISPDSIEVRFDTLIYHGAFYKTDFYFIYSRSGISIMYDIKKAARDSLDIQFANWYGSGDSMWLAVNTKLDSISQSCSFYDNGVTFNPLSGYSVSGVVTLQDSVSDNGSTIITIPIDVPTGDSIFMASNVFRRFTDAGSGLIAFMEAVRYKEWQDSSATGSIRFFASYVFTGTTDIHDTHIWEQSSPARNTFNYGGAISLFIYPQSGAYDRISIIKALNVATRIGSGATIQGCSLCVNVNSIIAGAGDVRAYRVFKPWNEGNLDGTAPGDSAAGNGLITWLDWSAVDEEWGTSGGQCAGDDGSDNSADGGGCTASTRDRKATQESTVNIATTGDKFFAITTGLFTGWYDGSIGERGVTLIGVTDNTLNIRMNSSENSKGSNPYFRVWYSTGGGGVYKGSVIITGGD